ncbi:hypothetical protein [Variovorax sp. 770b2]|uniref:hypothetical protein n=1 Tax=Variovorax sp. 770b2 TaxID=1566271 RepID=UPI0008F0183D|nr:hypothetical protein [Variovorax sp. 770b2]SFQ32674.1 hypothetical protein SAMN03159339_6732 [Variovorax sp. 770b2]
MTPVKVWLLTFLSGFFVIVALLILTLTTPIPYGDLTRLGLISDSEFGWTREPPHVPPELLRAAPVAQADVLVIGDSFSSTGRWQSVLTRGGYRVTTVLWGQVNESLCDDFGDWLARNGFKGKLVIIESVERILNARVAQMRSCRQMKKPFESRVEPFATPAENVPGFALNWDAKITSGWYTVRNTRRAKATAADTTSGYATKARSVVNGCEMFSHRLCTKALFFSEDDSNGELPAENIATMQAFTKAQSSIPILWMVIPNKTTTYIDLDHSKAFVEVFKASGLGPDLFSFAQEKKTQIRDFYFPNDTHLSMHGQLALGERMLVEVRKNVPEPP